MKKGVKGQANVLTIVLIIMIALVGVVILYNIVRPLISEDSEAIEAGYEKLLLAHLEVTDWSESLDNTLNITLRASTGDDVGRVKFILENSTDICYVEQDIDIQALETRTYNIPTAGCNNVINVNVEVISGSALTSNCTDPDGGRNFYNKSI